MLSPTEITKPFLDRIGDFYLPSTQIIRPQSTQLLPIGAVDRLRLTVFACHAVSAPESDQPDYYRTPLRYSCSLFRKSFEKTDSKPDLRVVPCQGRSSILRPQDASEGHSLRQLLALWLCDHIVVWRQELILVFERIEMIRPNDSGRPQMASRTSGGFSKARTIPDCGGS